MTAGRGTRAAPPEAVRVTAATATDGAAAEAPTPQRRAHVRAASRLPVRVQRLLPGGEPTGALDTFALDVSGGGLRIAGPDVLTVGDRVRFELALPEARERIEGRARVARRAADGTHGIEIEDVPAGRRDRIVRHVFERQRELLERRRDEADAALATPAARAAEPAPPAAPEPTAPPGERRR